jgi:NTP pyrophosphatase (non-canonical NTP hydrolase)
MLYNYILDNKIILLHEKIKKIIRDDGGEVLPEKKKEIEKELGDVLWYMTQLATELGLSLEDIAEKNIEKLYS